jgi:hypothetical protein
MAGHLTRSDCEEFEEVLYIQYFDGTVDVFGIEMKRLGMLALSVRKMKIMT